MTPYHPAEMIQAYNNTPRSTTGHTPYFWMFGQYAKLLMDNVVAPWGDEFSGTDGSWVHHCHKTLVTA